MRRRSKGGTKFIEVDHGYSEFGKRAKHGCDKTLYWRVHRGASRCNGSEMASPGVPWLLLRSKGLRRGVIEVVGVPRRHRRLGHVACLQAQSISFTPRPNPPPPRSFTPPPLSTARQARISPSELGSWHELTGDDTLNLAFGFRLLYHGLLHQKFW
jgi:hypothetical protein